MEMRVDHIGLAVHDLAQALSLWERILGTKGSEPEVVHGQGVRVSFVGARETHLELLEPTSPDSPVARFLAKRGEGIHHVAFGVPDLPATLAQLRASGMRLIDEKPRVGAGARLVAFVHPSSVHGVLTEFVQSRQDR